MNPNLRTFGISPRSYGFIVEAVSSHEQIEAARVFGTRAWGTARPGSDIDIAIYGVDVTNEIVARLKTQLNDETPIPYTIEVVHYEALTDDTLREKIDDNSEPMYKRGTFR